MVKYPRTLVLGVAMALGVAASCVEPDSTSVSESEPSLAEPAPAEPFTGDIVAPSEITWASIDTESGEAARTLVPLQMYFVERYLADVPDKTPTDLAFAAILDGSSETRDFFVGILDSYRQMPDAEKAQRFDPDVMHALAAYTEPLDLSIVGTVFDVMPAIIDLVQQTPLPPTELAALNVSMPGSLEQDPTGGGQVGPDPVYRVVLTWQDNAFNEDGFRIYRWSDPAPADVAPDVLAVVGPDAQLFDDLLAEPLSVDDMVCYQVRAYRDASADAENLFGESDPSDAVCLEYHWSKIDPCTDRNDTDTDGLLNCHDECPNLADNGDVTGPAGCPDADGDGWPDDGTDQCPYEPGDPGYGSGRTPFEAPTGCPNRFGVNWMSLEAVNNSLSYAYGINNITTPDGKWAFLSMNEVDDREGEEPYLIFEWLNGWNDTGDQETGRAQWCCGEGIDVAAGSVYEPDGTTLAEGDQDLDRAVREHGLVVVPPGEISDPGLLITTILMEMDWTAMVRKESADTAADLLQAAGEFAAIVSGCIASAGLGCLVDIGIEIVEGFLSIFGVESNLVEVDDPDDVMGDAVWVMSHDEALRLTADDGAHGFSFEAPNPNAVACLDGASPCPIEIAVPSRLTVTVNMCLYREGVPAAELTTLCAPYEPVLPWPMEPLAVSAGG